MPTLDFALDYLSILKSQGFDYYLVLVAKGKKKNLVSLEDHVTNEETRDVMAGVLVKSAKQLLTLDFKPKKDKTNKVTKPKKKKGTK